MYNNLLSLIKGFYTRYRLYFSVSIMLVVFAVLAYYIKAKSADFKIIFNISRENIIMLILASIFFRIALGYNFYFLALFFDINMKIKECMGVTTISTMTNYLLPAKGGTAIQALYFKKVYGFGYSQFLSLTIGFVVIGAMLNASVGLALSIIARIRGMIISDGMIFFFTAFTIVAISAFILMRNAAKFKIPNIMFKNIVNGLQSFNHNRAILTRFAMSQIFVILAVGLRIFFAFRAVNAETNFMTCVIIAMFTSFSVFFSLTPANLGIKEFFITYSSIAVGVSPAQGFVVALIDRVFDIITSFIGGGIFSFLFSNMQWWQKTGESA